MSSPQSAAQHYTTSPACTYGKHLPDRKGKWTVWQGGCGILDLNSKAEALAFCEAANHGYEAALWSVQFALRGLKPRAAGGGK